ncbi:MAG: LLM class flavin-dependent oxidoreductase [Chloroflexi bacterium]|nr:LLM class flavin-dependent oxidoreductase [Chloroflexota bacterium]
MSKYGFPLQFGLSVSPATSRLPQLLELVQAADQAGLDFIAIQDHPYNRTFMDTWTLIAYLAGRTGRVRFFPDVANLPLRPPAMLAKSAATLDRLSGGRVELGLGGGAYWDAITAMGGPQLASPGDAVAATAEAIQVIRLAWSGERGVSFDGRFYQLHGYQPGPEPAHPMGIWVGAARPRMLRLTGRLADGWVAPMNLYLPPEKVPAAQAIIDAAARQAGRSPSAIRRIANISGHIGPGSLGAEGLSGPAGAWAETLDDWAGGLGFDTFIYWPQTASPAQVERFANEVVPAVRAAAGPSPAGVSRE